MYRTISYAFIGLLVGLIFGFIAAVLFAPETPPGGPTPVATSVILFGVAFAIVIGAIIFARARNRKDAKPNSINYSRTPPWLVAITIIFLSVELLGFIAGVVALIFLQEVLGLDIRTINPNVMAVVFYTLGALFGVYVVRRLRLLVTQETINRTAVYPCIFILMDVIIRDWQTILESPLSLLAYSLLVIPIFLVVRFGLKVS